MADNMNQQQKVEELSPEIRAVLEKDQENRKKLAEIFAQCWDDEEFKKKFMEAPVKYFDEYGIEYDKTKDYKVIDSKPRTVTYVLPYENVSEVMASIGKAFEKAAEGGEANRKVIPEGWSLEFIQNTIDTTYLVIPVNPEKLTPEELEMINGGLFLFFILNGLIIFNVAALATVMAALVFQMVATVAIYAGGVVFTGAAVMDKVAVG